MPAENPITEAISSVIQEYSRIAKKSDKKRAPKIKGKKGRGGDMIRKVFEEQGLSLTEFRSP